MDKNLRLKTSNGFDVVGAIAITFLKRAYIKENGAV